MISRRDRLLEQLGIIQWVLRYADVLQGEVSVNLSPEIRLLIVAQLPPRIYDLLFCDVLRSLGLTPAQTYGIRPRQVTMLPREDTNRNIWRMGIEEPLVAFGVQLYSPVLSELSQDPQAKLALWQQICYNEKYFYSKSSCI